MQDNMTPEILSKRMLERLEGVVDTREGSYTADLVAPAALELFKLYQTLDAAIPTFYIDERSGPYIDKQAAWYGMARKPGTAAEVAFTFTGEAGAIVPAGSIFTTVGGLRFATREKAVLPAGADALAVEPGTRYNVDAGEITQQYISVPGVTGVLNPEAAHGGADAESDAALFARVQAFRSKPATSGNVNHYTQWALEVPGVGAARVIPVEFGAGTVGILLAGPDGGPVEERVVQECSAHIAQLRPVCADVRVRSAQTLAINVSAAVSLVRGATLERVREEFVAGLRGYLKTLTFSKYEIPYNRVAYMLLDTEGVENYTTLTLNGGTVDLAVGQDDAPVLGEVTLE